MSISESKKRLEAARSAYHKAPTREARELINVAMKELSSTIADGAEPCPLCGQKPHGMEQPTAKGVEFEIGCLGCKPIKHTDGTTRRPAVRGGLLPRHAVEAWNAGPDFWLKV